MAPYLGAGFEVDCAQLPRLNHRLAPDRPAGDIGLVDEMGAREEEPSRRCVMSKPCYLRAGLEGVDGPLPGATVRCVASAGEQVTFIRRNGSEVQPTVKEGDVCERFPRLGVPAFEANALFTLIGSTFDGDQYIAHAPNGPRWCRRIFESDHGGWQLRLGQGRHLVDGIDLPGVDINTYATRGLAIQCLVIGTRGEPVMRL